jgi:hypothetical protein
MSKIRVKVRSIAAVSFCLLGCHEGLAQAPPTAPPQAAAYGFSTLVFNENFSTDTFTPAATTRRWWNNFWFFPPAVGTSVMLPEGGVVRMTTPGYLPNTHLVNHPVNTAAYGPDYLFGYFEARMRFLPGADSNVGYSWGAFWLLSKPAIENRVSDANGNKSWCEIDVAEMFGPYMLNTTIHSWYQPSGETMQNTQNPNHLSNVLNNPIDGNWHTFGVLWRKGVVTWYMDNVQVATYRHSFSVCNTQPMTIVLSAQTLAAWHSQITDVDWVRVWR